MSESNRSEVTRSRKFAQNGVRQIIKREWTEAEFEAWFASLKTMETPTNTSADIYEIIHTGDKNFQIVAGNAIFWADGIENKTILEAKFVGKPERSPYIENSDYPEFLRIDAIDKLHGAFVRIIEILLSPDNPLTLLRIITNNSEAISFFEKLTREHRIPCKIVIKTETDILSDTEPGS